MIFQNANGEKSVQSVRRTGSSGDYSLTWDSCGLDNFLVVIGESEEAVKVKAGDAEAAPINKLLCEAESQLADQDRVVFSNVGITVYKVTFSQLKQKGGFSANGKPGIYAVYGYCNDGGESVVYAAENNSIRFTVDVSIEDVPVSESKGVFKKKEVYSGYHRVSIKKGIPGLRASSIYYTVASNDYKYPFPEEIVANGGSFYVKCAEGDALRFGTTNNDGIRIK